MNRAMLLTVCSILISTSLSATEIPTTRLGELLFKADNLGTNGKSCHLCHPGGEGLSQITTYDDGMLKEMINGCIRDAMKGRMMDLESTEMESFLKYLRTIQDSM